MVQLSFHVSHSQIYHVKLILRRVLVSLVIHTSVMVNFVPELCVIFEFHLRALNYEITPGETSTSAQDFGTGLSLGGEASCRSQNHSLF